MDLKKIWLRILLGYDCILLVDLVLETLSSIAREVLISSNLEVILSMQREADKIYRVFWRGLF